MNDDIHTGIRNIEDIKTFEEAFFEDGEYSGMDPDFTQKMANEAIETGKITVYSSYPIEKTSNTHSRPKPQQQPSQRIYTNDDIEDID